MSATMNEDIVLFLLTNPRLSDEKKLELKNKRPTPKLHLTETEHTQNRTFQTSWYEKYPWLTGSLMTSKLYCYVCLMFGGREEWSKDGIGRVKNFDRKAQKHEVSKAHIQNNESFHLLGRLQLRHSLSEALHLMVTKHNEEVSLNRLLLGRFIQTVIFLCKQDLPLNNHQNSSGGNKGNYLEMLDFLAQKELSIRDHLLSPTGFKGTSVEFQNDVLEAITKAVDDKMQSEIQECSFISVQIDSTFHLSSQTQISVIFRYCFQDNLQERFIGLYNLEDSSTNGLSETVHQVLQKWNAEGKVVSQTYDASLVMSRSIRAEIVEMLQQFCPHAYFVHSYAHNLNSMLLHGTRTIPQVRLFLSDLLMFCNFFHESPKRILFLAEKGFALPEKWSFSTAVPTILAHFSKLYEAFDHIVADSSDRQWDLESTKCALELKRKLEDPLFMYLLFLYMRCFSCVAKFAQTLQSESGIEMSNCHPELQTAILNLEHLCAETIVREFVKNSKSLNKNLTFRIPENGHFQSLTKQIVTSCIHLMKSRFGELSHVDFVELVNYKKFLNYAAMFPRTLHLRLLEQYPFFNSEQLENELRNLYSDLEKRKPPLTLLKYLYSNGLEPVYEETTELLRLVLTLPVTPANTDRTISTLKRVKNCLRNHGSVIQSPSAIKLSVEKDLLSKLTCDHSFIEHVTDLIAPKYSEQFKLVYEKV